MISASSLFSMDGFFNEEESDQPSSSSGGSGIYHKSFCSMDSSGRVVGLAYRRGRDYMAALQEPDYMSWEAAMPAQRQFYENAVFMGCKGGDIELGMSSSTNNLDVRSYFTDEVGQSRPSSSSSSLRSFSGGSPECCSFLRNIATTSCAPDAFKDVSLAQAVLPIPSLPVQTHPITVPAYSRLSNSQFSSLASDDTVMMNAILAVMSAKDPVDQSPHTTSVQITQHHRTNHGGQRAFTPYKSTVGGRIRAGPNKCRPSMIKTLHSILRHINNSRAVEAAMPELKPTTNQLHHMISERRRREKLNESFQALRSLLPPGTRKDKASLLATTKDYLNSLKAQISDLEDKNRKLETRLSLMNEADENMVNDRVIIQINRASESSCRLQKIGLKVIVRAVCDMIDLVLHILGCLKEMGNITLVSIDANTSSSKHLDYPSRRTTLALQFEAADGDWDEETFKEAIKAAVDESLAQPPPPPPFHGP